MGLIFCPSAHEHGWSTSHHYILPKFRHIPTKWTQYFCWLSFRCEDHRWPFVIILIYFSLFWTGSLPMTSTCRAGHWLYDFWLCLQRLRFSFFRRVDRVCDRWLSFCINDWSRSCIWSRQHLQWRLFLLSLGKRWLCYLLNITIHLHYYLTIRICIISLEYRQSIPWFQIPLRNLSLSSSWRQVLEIVIVMLFRNLLFYTINSLAKGPLSVVSQISQFTLHHARQILRRDEFRSHQCWIPRCQHLP